MKNERGIGIKQFTILLAALLSLPFLQTAKADDISPSMGNGDRTYSHEAADTAYFGNGMGSRLSEASYLRFQGQADLDDGKIEDAIAKIGKAVKLDPGDPDTHYLYAKAITAKFYANKGTIDEKQLARCIDEWKLIWHHDSDQSNQMDAKWQALKLMRISRAIAKQKQQKEKEENMVADAARKQEAKSDDKPLSTASQKPSLDQ